MRLDQYLVYKKLATSRTQAQDMIENGFVYLLQNQQKKILTKPSYDVKDEHDERIAVENNELQRYVSRAGLKLEKALQKTKLQVSGLKVLDIGQSTGGFTDCLLQHSVDSVVGVDVGTEQLHEQLRIDPRVYFFENLNARELDSHIEFQKRVPADKFDLAVADVSFISLTKVTEALGPLIRRGGHYLFLVKPQFECGPEFLDKNGIVSDKQVYKVIEQRIRQNCCQVFGSVLDYFNSEFPGKDGNQEFFVYGQKN